MRYGIGCASSFRARHAASVVSSCLVARLTSEALTVSPQSASTTLRTAARADALQGALGQSAEECLLVALVAGEHGGLEERRAVAWHLQLERADPRDERARARAVPQAAALRRAFVRVGAEELGELAVEGGLHELLDELTEGVGVSAEGCPGERARGRGGLLQQPARATVGAYDRGGHQSGIPGFAGRQPRW
jgi:hypothetical protein